MCPRAVSHVRTAGLDDDLCSSNVCGVVRAGRADQLHRVRGDDEERRPGAVQPQEAARHRPVEEGRGAREHVTYVRLLAGIFVFVVAEKLSRRVRSISGHV